jgi:hypothetical protein
VVAVDHDEQDDVRLPAEHDDVCSNGDGWRGF